MQKKVSVVVLNWNGKKHLKICLESLKLVNYSSLEVIVVDNNSTDGTVEMVEKSYPWVRLVKNKKNVGYAKGNNIGIRESSSEFVFILNNDTKVTQDFIDPLVSLMDSDQKIACVQPKLLYAIKPTILNAVGSFLTSFGFLYHYGYRKKEELSKYNRRMDIYSAKGAAMLLRKTALNKVGLFDEDFFIFFEETDLCHRLWLAGFRIVYEPSSIIFHFEAVDTSKQMRDSRRTYLSLRNRVCSYIKNLETRNLINILIMLSFIYAAFFIHNIFMLRFNLSIAVISSIIWNIKEFPNTLKKRRIIQRKLRKISDDELFRIIKKNPPIKYYYHLFFGNLKDFTNEKAI